MNYNFPTKRHWRRTLWNSIVARVAVPSRSARVLYLAGAADEDREIALQKGFAATNLVALERDARSVSELRSAGVLTLAGDAFEHIRAWAPHRQVHAVVLDLCCGLTDEVLFGVADLCLHPAFQGAVVAVNMLRGRDPQSNGRRWHLQDQMRELSAVAGLEGAEFLGVADPLKHRGSLLRHFLCDGYFCGMTEHFASQRGIAVEQYIMDEAALAADEIHVRLARLTVNMHDHSQVLSYRSVMNQTFDTLVFVNEFHESLQVVPDLDLSAYRMSPLRRQQAAIEAHRTRRQNS